MVVTVPSSLPPRSAAFAVAEGLETEAQREFLARQGCPLAQGFLLGVPAPPEIVEGDITPGAGVVRRAGELRHLGVGSAAGLVAVALCATHPPHAIPVCSQPRSLTHLEMPAVHCVSAILSPI